MSLTDDATWAEVWDRSKWWVVYLGLVLACGMAMHGCQ